MGVLATFDAEANWVQTDVCDRLLAGCLRRLGGAWGRWKVAAPCPADGPLAALFESRHSEIARLHRRWGTDQVERVRLLPDAQGWLQRRGDWRRFAARDGATAYAVLEGTLLVHVESGSGHVGVLCEAGEWLAIPAGLRYAIDAGEAPDVDVLMLSSVGANHGHATAAPADPGLPSLDEFIETMLEMTGHAEEG